MYGKAVAEYMAARMFADSSIANRTLEQLSAVLMG